MNKKTILGLLVILLVEFLYIFTFLLNYDLAWMNSEKFGVRKWILSNGPQWQREDWTKFLNIDVIECNAYRLSRPLSNFVEVVDSKWRASLWHITTPHPAISLQWPFMFILLPWLLYQTFVNLGCFPFVALAGVCVYITTVGFLGPLVMLFHPSKNLANFFGVLTMFLFSLSYKNGYVSLAPNGSVKRISGGVLTAAYVSMFMGFFSDETGIYLYIVSLLLFHRLWLKLWDERRYWSLSGLIILPIMYLLTISVILPYCHWLYNGVWIHLNSYESYPSIKTLFWPDWIFFWQNVRFLFADHPHLLINYHQVSSYPWMLGIQLIYVVAVLTLIFFFFRSMPTMNREENFFVVLLVIGILLMIGYCFFQTFQLSKNVKAWGIWWYGSLFSFIYIFPLVFFLQIIFSNQKWLCKWALVFVFIFVLNGLAFGTYRLSIFKLQNLNRSAYSFMGIFKGTVDPYQSFNFKRSLERSYCKKMYAHLYWRHWKGLAEDVDPVEKDKCFSGPLASDFYFMTEENGYLLAELN